MTALFFSPCPAADDQLELLNRLIAGGEGLGLHLEQVDILKANVEVSGCCLMGRLGCVLPLHHLDGDSCGFALGGRLFST